jgi:hypothetical protein
VIASESAGTSPGLQLERSLREGLEEDQAGREIAVKAARIGEGLTV